MVRVRHGWFVYPRRARATRSLSRGRRLASSVIGRLARLLARAADHRHDRDRRRLIRECERRERGRIAGAVQDRSRR